MSEDRQIEVPLVRPRRLRRTPALRRMVAETHVVRRQPLVLPVFVREGLAEPRAISSMPASCGSLRATPSRRRSTEAADSVSVA